MCFARAVRTWLRHGLGEDSSYREGRSFHEPFHVHVIRQMEVGGRPADIECPGEIRTCGGPGSGAPPAVRSAQSVAIFYGICRAPDADVDPPCLQSILRNVTPGPVRASADTHACRRAALIIDGPRRYARHLRDALPEPPHLPPAAEARRRAWHHRIGVRESRAAAWSDIAAP